MPTKEQHSWFPLHAAGMLLSFQTAQRCSVWAGAEESEVAEKMNTSSVCLIVFSGPRRMMPKADSLFGWRFSRITAGSGGSSSIEAVVEEIIFSFNGFSSVKIRNLSFPAVRERENSAPFVYFPEMDSPVRTPAC